MRVDGINKNFNNTFKSLKLKNSSNNYSDTSFYRDPTTLCGATKILFKQFPEGCDILDFAGSNGEEAISLYSFLNDKNDNKYKIYAYDTSEKALDLARKGVYTVYRPWSFDSFLLEECDENDFYKYPANFYLPKVKRCFSEVMEKTSKPNFEINDTEFIEHLKIFDNFKIEYFKLKENLKSKFSFNFGNINDIKDLAKDKKVGAVLFRNAMYIETQNWSLKDYDRAEELDINKSKIIENIVSKVYDVLEPGGLFILGDIEKDFVYLADKFVDENNRKFLPEFFVEIYKKSPLIKALQKNNRFHLKKQSNVSQPILMEKCAKVPTIWQKTGARSAMKNLPKLR